MPEFDDAWVAEELRREAEVERELLEKQPKLFKSIENLELSENQRNFVNVCKASFESTKWAFRRPPYPSNTLCDDFEALFAKADSLEHLSSMLNDFWRLVVEIARMVPVNEAWGALMAGCLTVLQERPGEVKSGYPLLWKDLPGLDEVLQDVWRNDPTVVDQENQGSPPSQEDLSKWENLNHFFAYFFADGLKAGMDYSWIQFPLCQLATALEIVHEEGALHNCRLRVACCWVQRSTDTLYRVMSCNLDLRQLTSRPSSFRLKGPRCPGAIQPFSLERWNNWKHDFLVDGSNRVDLGLDHKTVGMILDTILYMTWAEDPKAQDRFLAELKLKVVERSAAASNTLLHPREV
ncbi:hypothetical protein QBC46DRAFT_417490 [Diplogelasinospora grovesii]|uniref:Uncharacterized protein n=1 Tax=Diplogelasinospora grovesii TaxID=303347 RepID=A0AAN6S1W2_9PEZI|nr:hypothetical protein QBC46DRAFT_417490 [Diplogelasinospora grovesii]